MLEKLKASIKVKCPGKETDLDSGETRGSVSINGEEKEKFTLRAGEEKTLEVEFDTDDGDHNLTVEHLYSPNSTSAIIIDTIILDDVDLGVILYKGGYTPTYPEPWYTDETNAGRPPKEVIGGPDGLMGSAPLFMGWEGTYTLKFSTPLYEWLLDHL